MESTGSRKPEEKTDATLADHKSCATLLFQFVCFAFVKVFHVQC